MWPGRYFSPRMWAARFWAKVGATWVIPTGTRAASRVLVVNAESRALVSGAETRILAPEFESRTWTADEE